MTSYSDLPQEIIFNIISRVPAKSVGMWRCVSKPWRAMLSQPNFIKTHLQVTKINSLESLVFIRRNMPLFRLSKFYIAPSNNAHHLFDKITLSLTEVSFPGYNPLLMGKVYGSCDGLLLVLGYGDKIFVMNPITGEIRQLPLPLLALDYHEAQRGRGDSIADFLYGFGYDSVGDDYKVLIISLLLFLENSEYVTKETFFDVFSLKTGSWKRLECSIFHNYLGSRLTPGAFVSGCFHWLVDRATNDKLAIAVFDLADENFREVPHPSLIFNLKGYYSIFDCQIGVLGGCLCMCYANKPCEIWVMKEYGVPESWTKFAANKPRGWFECFFNCQEQVVIQFDDVKHIMWNLKQGTSKEIVFNGLKSCLDNLDVKASFVESLVSPHGRL